MKQCNTCVYGLTCRQPRRVFSVTVGEEELVREEAERPRADCLPDYKHYKEGDPRVRLLELQRSGAINIVIGGEGEHEVNANWSIVKAYEHLAATCEACGGLVVRDGFTKLVLMKTYGPNFVLDWMHGKLYRISIRQHEPWWEAK